MRRSRKIGGRMCPLAWAGILLFVSIAVASAASAQAADSMPKPVDPSWLKGRTLTVPGANFSIDAPGLDWEWQIGKPVGENGEGQTLTCSKSGRAVALSVLIVAMKDVDKARDLKFLEGVAEGIQETSPNGAFRYEPSASPIAGSYAFHFDGRMPGGIFRHAVGATCWTGKGVALMALYRDGAEPREYRAFLESFHLLSPLPVAAASERASVIGALRYLALLAFFLVLGALLKRSAWFRARFNLWGFAALALLLSVVVHLVVTVVSPAFREIRDPVFQGKVLGAIAGSSFLSFVIVGIGSLFREKKTA